VGGGGSTGCGGELPRSMSSIEEGRRRDATVGVVVVWHGGECTGGIVRARAARPIIRSHLDDTLHGCVKDEYGSARRRR
jgi:hypothetical protein